jgi:hypothetical protein
MPAGKISTLTFRIAAALKEALRTAAEREHRSIANMVEVFIRGYCERNEISIVKFGAVVTDTRHAIKNRR